VQKLLSHCGLSGVDLLALGLLDLIPTESLIFVQASIVKGIGLTRHNLRLSAG
jgi:hypothetical protein